MNRHERRRAFALGMRAGQTGEFPPAYIAVIDGIVTAYLAWREQYPTAEPPRFTLPPKDILLAASLAGPIGQRIAKNPSARELIDLVCMVASTTGDMRKMPTVFMLDAAMRLAGVSVERVSLAELGLSAGGEKGRNN